MRIRKLIYLLRKVLSIIINKLILQRIGPTKTQLLLLTLLTPIKTYLYLTKMVFRALERLKSNIWKSRMKMYVYLILIVIQ